MKASQLYLYHGSDVVIDSPKWNLGSSHRDFGQCLYNAAGIIMRAACAVHVRRPFWKLKEISDDAARVVYLFDEVFQMRQIAIYRNIIDGLQMKGRFMLIRIRFQKP